MMPSQSNVPSTIVELTQTSKLSGLDVRRHHAGARRAGSPFGMQSITLKLQGTYFDLEDYLYRLESYVQYPQRRLRRHRPAAAAGERSAGPATSSRYRAQTLDMSITLNAYLWPVSAATTTDAATTGGTHDAQDSHHHRHRGRAGLSLAVALTAGPKGAVAVTGMGAYGTTVASQAGVADTASHHGGRRRPSASTRPSRSRCSTSSRARTRSSTRRSVMPSRRPARRRRLRPAARSRRLPDEREDHRQRHDLHREEGRQGADLQPGVHHLATSPPGRDVRADQRPVRRRYDERAGRGGHSARSMSTTANHQTYTPWREESGLLRARAAARSSTTGHTIKVTSINTQNGDEHGHVHRRRPHVRRQGRRRHVLHGLAVRSRS